MRLAFPALLLVALAACEESVPNSAEQVGFQDFREYNIQRARREAQLSGQIAAPEAPEPEAEPELQVAEPVPAAPAPETEAEATAAAAMAALQVTTAEPEPAPEPAPAPQPAPQVAAAPQSNTNNPNISDEQDFDAVSNRETIESDAERLKAQRQAYQVIEPEAVPNRPSGSGGAGIIQFALATSNAVGQPLYRRSFGSPARAARACARFATSDQAQEAFLAAGGPERDRRGVDPDGDGFACDWDPTPFRQVRN